MSVPALITSLMAVALASPGATAPAPPAGSSSLCRNGFYVVHDKRVMRFDEHALDRVEVGELGDHVNALAYFESEELLYGIAETAGVSHVVTVDAEGEITDRGVAPAQIQGAYAGAADGQQWILHSGHEVVTVTVPGLTVAATAKLPEGFDVGDWDLHQGQLYGVAAGSTPRLMKVDPRTGQVTVVATPAGLARGSSYGAAAVDPHGILHVVHNATGRVYHLPLADPGRVTFTEAGLTAFHADAAVCPLELDVAESPAAQHTRTTIGELTLGRLPEVTIAAEATSLTLTVPVRNTTPRDALLAGWHDLNHDGRLAPEERATASVAPGAQAAVLTWPVLAVGLQQEVSRLRLRLFGFAPDPVLPDGPASGGEVQDHPLRIVWPMPRPAPPPPPPPQIRPAPTPAAAPPPSPSASPPARMREPAVPSSRKLPLTWTLFAGMLVPAITVAARAGGRRGAA